jgi:hypothetical protein
MPFAIRPQPPLLTNPPQRHKVPNRPESPLIVPPQIRPTAPIRLQTPLQTIPPKSHPKVPIRLQTPLQTIPPKSHPKAPIRPQTPLQTIPPKSHPKAPKIDSEKKPPTKPPEKTEWLGRAVVVIATIAVTVAVAYFVYELACYISEIVRDKFSKETMPELEEKARKRGLGHIVDKVKQMDGIDKRRVIKRLAHCKGHEKRILKHLDEGFQFSANHMKEMLMGAHIRLDDSGKTCKEWATMAAAKQRISSHPSDGDQFSIKGTLIKELLFSAISEEDKLYTWFQLENHPVSFGSIVRHMVDYVKYKISSRNQGPFGSSRITDLKPLCIAEKT